MENWNEYKIGDLCEVGRGSSPRPIIDQRYFVDGNIPWIKIADATSSGKYIYETKEHVNDFGASFSRYLEPNSLIIAASGVSLGQIKFLGVKGCIHDGWLYVSNYNEEIIEKEYLYYFLINYSETFHNFSSGAAIQNINTEILRNTKIKLPSISIQQKIASILSSYDELIENNKQRIKLLEEMAEEIYKEWFVRLRFPGYENTKIVDGLPEGWDEKEFQFFGEIITGKTPSTTNEAFFNGNIPFVKTPDLHGFTYVIETNETLSDLGAKSQIKKFIPKNSLIISCIGSAGVYALSSKDCQTNQQINSIVFYEDYYCFYFYCFANKLKVLLENLGSNGATMTNVNKGKFEKMKAIYPTKEILIKFNELVKNNFELILNLQQKNQLLQETRDLLLPRLISGKLSVEHLLEEEALGMVAEPSEEYK